MASMKSLIFISAILSVTYLINADGETNARAPCPVCRFLFNSGFGQGNLGGLQFPSIPGIPDFNSQSPNFLNFGAQTLGSGRPLQGIAPSRGALSSGFSGFNIPGFPNFPGFPGRIRAISVAPGSSASLTTVFSAEEDTLPLSDRKRRQIGSSDHSEHQHRFLNHFPTITSCNFTVEGVRSCTSCNEALLCFPNNVGILKPCPELFSHCNGGLCSIFESEECRNSSTSSTTTTTPTTTTTSSV